MSSEEFDRPGGGRRQRAQRHARSRPTREQRIEARDDRRVARGRDRAGKGQEPYDLIWSRPEPGARRARLTREEIAGQALRVADAEGLEAVSMRRIAGELGVGTMTLYYYVRTKDELIELMQNEMMAEVLVPDGELPSDWRGALEAIARRTRDTFLRHSWAISAPPTSGGPNAIAHFEQSLAAVSSLGADRVTRLEVILMVDDFAFGFISRELGLRAERESPLAEESAIDAIVEWIKSQLGDGNYPNVDELIGDRDPREVLDELEASVRDTGRFQRGLSRLLDGIELDLERRGVL
jgi:AcrR family transcriptional regulator